MKEITTSTDLNVIQVGMRINGVFSKGIQPPLMGNQSIDFSAACWLAITEPDW
jgi:hypothetical protein